MAIRRRAAAALLLAGALALPAQAAEPGACSPLRGLIVPVAFAGTERTVERADIEQRFFRRLDGYVRQMSYGRVCIGGEVTRWYELPHTVTRYSISPRNLEVDPARVRRLVADVFAEVEREHDLAGFDFVAFVLGAGRDQYGMAGLAAYPGMLGWDERAVLRTRAGVRLPGVAIYTYQAHVGTLFHDLAHIVGGVNADGHRVVPCLYDHDLQARPGPPLDTFVASQINVGCWDPMSCHFYKPNLPPPGLMSWTRIRLGWLSEDKIATVRAGETREIVLGPLADPAAPTLAIRIPLTARMYYLVENRQPIGVDAVLPNHGVLILRADDDIPEARYGRAPVKLVNADPALPRFEGAPFDVGRRERYADAAAGVTIELLEKLGASYRIRVVHAGRR